MDPYEETIARLHTRYSGPELEARIRSVRRRQADAQDRNARFDRALEVVRAGSGPIPEDTLPFDRQYRESMQRVQARLVAGLITREQFEERRARLAATRLERAIKWAKYEYRAMGPAEKVRMRLVFRSTRPRYPLRAGQS